MANTMNCVIISEKEDELYNISVRQMLGEYAK